MPPSAIAASSQTPILWTTTPASLAWKAHHSSSQAHETASWPLAAAPWGSSEPVTLNLLWLDASHTARASTRHQMEHRAVGRGAVKPPSHPTLLPSRRQWRMLPCYRASTHAYTRCLSRLGGTASGDKTLLGTLGS